MTEELQYARRDTLALGTHYTRHVMAMTSEQLHSKSAIAAELAWRDAEIERLRALAAPSVPSGEPVAWDSPVDKRKFDKHPRFIVAMLRRRQEGPPVNADGTYTVGNTQPDKLCHAAADMIERLANTPQPAPAGWRLVPDDMQELGSLLCSVADNLGDMPISEGWAAKTAARAVALLERNDYFRAPAAPDAQKGPQP
jgi:hypothetical protein